MNARSNFQALKLRSAQRRPSTKPASAMLGRRRRGREAAEKKAAEEAAEEIRRVQELVKELVKELSGERR